MARKLACLAFAAFVVFQSSSSAEALDLQVLRSGTHLVNKRITSRIPYVADEYATTTGCGGVLKQAPGEIKQHFELGKSSNVECAWKIHAPTGHSVFVRSLEVFITSLPGRSLGDLTDSLELQIYEGNDVSEAKRLFDFKSDSSLDKCISNDQIILVVLRYTESGLHAEHDVSLKYGFAKQSDLSGLLK